MDHALPEPDLVFYLDLAPDAAAARRGFGDDRYETTTFQARVSAAYAAIERRSPWHDVDATRDADDLAAEILARALDELGLGSAVS